MSATRKPAPSACSCRCSTDINGSITKGRGKLDDFGFWEIPCTHGESGAPLQPGATQPEHDGVAHATSRSIAERACNGGDSVGQIEFMIDTLLERMARLVVQEAAQLIEHCNREGPYQAIGAAPRIRALLTPEKLQQLREAVERP